MILIHFFTASFRILQPACVFAYHLFTLVCLLALLLLLQMNLNTPKQKRNQQQQRQPIRHLNCKFLFLAPLG